MYNDFQVLQRNLTQMKYKKGITSSEQADIDIAKRVLNRVNMNFGGHSNTISLDDIKFVMGDKK